ncbi:VOC family protein [Rhizobium sp. PL01]|uniref:VOC family protein n=1 Tax=Rhizobium sp. PL01 TaxID=3085631 RepID=UPI0029816993|nr:VOC family protein [Rhizobium sp. PL01]MDW5318052.1 glyoxalase [Rhizobium sp. PL01]
MSEKRRVTAVIPYNDLAATEAFYGLLGFHRDPDGDDYGDYVMLTDEGGAEIHLTKAPEGWLIPGKSPFGIYFYADNVEALASQLEGKLIHPPKQQPWGMFEFAVSDPGENLVRVGRRTS